MNVKQQLEALLAPLAAVVAAAALLWGLSAALLPTARSNALAERDAVFRTLLPGSETFTPEAHDGGDGVISAVYRGEGGYVIETVTGGYDGDLTLWVGVGDDGRVTGLMTRDLSETWGLGGNALRDTSFLGQFPEHRRPGGGGRGRGRHRRRHRHLPGRGRRRQRGRRLCDRRRHLLGRHGVGRLT